MDSSVAGMLNAGTGSTVVTEEASGSSLASAGICISMRVGDTADRRGVTSKVANAANQTACRDAALIRDLRVKNHAPESRRVASTVKTTRNITVLMRKTWLIVPPCVPGL
jgi:hypothetical protein